MIERENASQDELARLREQHERHLAVTRMLEAAKDHIAIPVD